MKAFHSSDRNSLAEIFSRAGGLFVPGLDGAAAAYFAGALFHDFPCSWLCITDGPRTQETCHRDLQSLFPGHAKRILNYPAWEAYPNLAPEITGERLRAQQALVENSDSCLVVSCIQALMQPTLSPQELERTVIPLRKGDQADPADLASKLLAAGYRFSHEVFERGQASLRGGILDVWPPDSEYPVRLDFFGDTLDSIRHFNAEEQTSIAKIESVRLSPAMENMAVQFPDPTASLLSYFPEKYGVVFFSQNRIREHGRLLEDSMKAEIGGPGLDAVLQRVEKKAAHAVYLGQGRPPRTPQWESPFHPVESLPRPAGTDYLPDIMEKARREYVEGLLQKTEQGSEVRVFFDTAGTRERFLTMDPRHARFKSCVAPLSAGFSYPAQSLMAITESDILGYQKVERRGIAKTGRKKPPAISRPILSQTEIQPGEYVVHVGCGIGKYLGLYEIRTSGQLQEVLAVEYADGAKLYVPVAQSHLLSRYMGVGRRRPQLHRLGGGRWDRQKEAAEQAIMDMSASLLETQAAREMLRGHAFPPDDKWMHEFEASFPFEETPDQARAITEVKQDMESHKPMDRLVCGDVGYGKTEVAMRAAFKAVASGKQVAILVPTTILAQQHYDTFSQRMAAYPFKIEMLSRFRTKAEQDRVIEMLGEGQIDIVIGTHRLVQRDVGFKDLGLVIIDEEQRFGVGHKEHLKHLRRLVDVMTLTATPIPRTLYMSLTGAKDMSTIQSPPQERLPIETIVTETEDHTIRQAILRELNREGQVFFLHNRVKSIGIIAEKLMKIVPEARIAVAHGQMAERELAAVMRKFAAREMDVLLCTTIIESGLDMPNVNTILIDRADRFGLADLYQLRGRVGRYKHRAFAYFLLPKDRLLYNTAQERIRAIQRYSSLGAGFKVALRDLEIRGSGNILGRQQSGHIAAIGFDLYCQLLRQTIAKSRGERLSPAVRCELKLDFITLSAQQAEAAGCAAIPYDYMEDENLRVNTYRRIAGMALEDELDAVEAELADRFGPLPPPFVRLLKTARIRVRATACGIDRVETREDKIMLMRGGDYLQRSGRFPRMNSDDATIRLDEILDELCRWRVSPENSLKMPKKR